jgi:hypothetical protein
LISSKLCRDVIEYTHRKPSPVRIYCSRIALPSPPPCATMATHQCPGSACCGAHPPTHIRTHMHKDKQRDAHIHANKRAHTHTQSLTKTNRDRQKRAHTRTCTPPGLPCPARPTMPPRRQSRTVSGTSLAPYMRRAPLTLFRQPRCPSLHPWHQGVCVCVCVCVCVTTCLRWSGRTRPQNVIE